MRGMRSADPRVTTEVFPSLEALPDDATRLFDTSETLFTSRVWWRCVLDHALPPGAMPGFLLCRINGTAAGLFPMLREDGGWRAFTTPYTCLYTPLISPDSDPIAVCREFHRTCRAYATTRLDCLPPEWAHLDALAAGDRLATLRFDHFGNWHEHVAGLGWDGYLASRPGALRETIRRRLRRAERLPEARFSLVTGGEGLEPAIAAFEAVYASSWKEPEPFPRFNAELMRATAVEGTLRLGLWSLGGQTIAAQFWISERGQATVLKLAHDEAFKAHSPGTVLTALMLRHLLDTERVEKIDFGRGDDPYKRDWARDRRQRIGLVLANPYRPTGLCAILRHALGRLRSSAG